LAAAGRGKAHRLQRPPNSSSLGKGGRLSPPLEVQLSLVEGRKGVPITSSAIEGETAPEGSYQQGVIVRGRHRAGSVLLVRKVWKKERQNSGGVKEKTVKPSCSERIQTNRQFWVEEGEIVRWEIGGIEIRVERGKSAHLAVARGEKKLFVQGGEKRARGRGEERLGQEGVRSLMEDHGKGHVLRSGGEGNVSASRNKIASWTEGFSLMYVISQRMPSSFIESKPIQDRRRISKPPPGRLQSEKNSSAHLSTSPKRLINRRSQMATFVEGRKQRREKSAVIIQNARGAWQHNQIYQ